MSRKTEDSQHIDRIVGNRIRYFRLRRNFSQHQLASALDISYQQLHKYEKGSNSASASRLADIAVALGVRVDDFFDEAAEPSDNHVFDREQIQLMGYLERIKAPENRRAVAKLIHSLAQQSA
jgi:transcriptional regulator with XRE-family HTH domain